MNTTPFDSTAAGYDLEFTETAVGKLQRAVTHRFLDAHLTAAQPSTVLELNCGTGEDALWLSRKGLLVTATDVSAGMVETTLDKVKGQGVRVLQSSIQEIGKVLPLEKYHLIWSNFGGLNCLSPKDLQAAAPVLQRLLRPGGYFVAVVMGRFCAWETLYHLAKFKPKAALRRLHRGPVQARLADGVFQNTYYYSVGQLEGIFAGSFVAERRLAVGAYLPPSYLDPFFVQRPNFLAQLNRWETRAYDRSFPARFSDHFLVAFRRR